MRLNIIGFIICFILMALVIFTNVGCNNETTKPPSSKRDTTLTLAAYLGYGLKGVQFGPARKIEWDTLMWVGKDSSTMKKELKRYRIYEVQVNIPVDSAAASIFGVPLLDSNGKKYSISRVLWADEKYVRDGITNLDSAVAELRQYMPKDSTNK